MDRGDLDVGAMMWGVNDDELTADEEAHVMRLLRNVLEAAEATLDAIAEADEADR